MNDLTQLHINNLTNQSILISALLCGFSMLVLILLLNDNEKSRLKTSMFISSAIASTTFLIVILADYALLRISTPNSYSSNSSIDTLQAISGISFAFGFLSLIFLIAYSGWSKSKTVGIFTTIIGIMAIIIGTQVMP